jgi:hypothetical protein
VLFVVSTQLNRKDIKLRGDSAWYRILKEGIVVYFKV